MRAVSFFGSRDGPATGIERDAAIAPLGIKGAADGGGEMGLVGAGGKGVCESGGGMGRDVIGGRTGK